MAPGNVSPNQRDVNHLQRFPITGRSLFVDHNAASASLSSPLHSVGVDPSLFLVADRSKAAVRSRLELASRDKIGTVA